MKTQNDYSLWVADSDFTLLLRSGWQTANIGDIAHALGVMAVFDRCLPNVHVIMWPSELNEEAEAVLRRQYPKVSWVKSAEALSAKEGKEGDMTIETAFCKADILVHGPGAGLNAKTQMLDWHDKTGKPWIALGVTLGSRVGSIDSAEYFPPELTNILNTATKIWTRESRSLAVSSGAGVTAPSDFCPDATFALDGLSDEAGANALMSKYGLHEQAFICVVPRLRLTPYWRMTPASTKRVYPESEVSLKESFNSENAINDHAVARAAIVAWVRHTGMKVLLCPEMSYANELFQPFLIDPLPVDVKDKVVAMDSYWMTDVACSVYARAKIVVSMECHSPIMAIAKGRPALYLLQPQDTWKWQMFPDLGLGDWVMPIETTDPEEVAAQVIKIHLNYDEECAKARAAREKAWTHIKAAITDIDQMAGSSQKSTV